MVRKYVQNIPKIHRPGTKVIDSGVYEVIDKHGCFLNLQIVAMQNQEFPMVDHPFAIGFILHVKAEHLSKGLMFKPADEVPYSGIYDVAVDGVRKYHDRQVTCMAGDNFPPMVDAQKPNVYSYVLNYRARYMPYIFLPGDKVERQDTYRVINYDGVKLDWHKKLNPNEFFPSFNDLHYFKDFKNWRDAYGYVAALIP